jgi:hypothetical protein
MGRSMSGRPVVSFSVSGDTRARAAVRDHLLRRSAALFNAANVLSRQSPERTPRGDFLCPMRHATGLREGPGALKQGANHRTGVLPSNISSRPGLSDRGTANRYLSRQHITPVTGLARQNPPYARTRLLQSSSPPRNNGPLHRSGGVDWGVTYTQSIRRRLDGVLHCCGAEMISS